MPRRDEPTSERLRAYRAKRDFSITAEPEGTDPPVADGWRFVVQRHRARALHYDVRLEAGGVLASWAVPKGPTLDPKARRLAVHVEDHPLDYFDFEGVIAPGEYGGGDVIVWDWGRWALADGDDPLAAIAAGDLHFALLGERLRGRFALVRRGDGGRREQWLLIKKRDDDAVAGWDPEEHPRSVKSGRTNDEVRDAPAASWTGGASWAGPTDDELTALDELATRGTWTLGGHGVRLTDLDDVMFPPRDRRRRPLRKRDLVRHYAQMAPVLLPYLADRPVDLHRYPDGVGGKGRWQRSVPGGAPAWISRRRASTSAADDGTEHLLIDSAAALAWVGNRCALELGLSTSKLEVPDHPNWTLFHIGPGPDGRFADVIQAVQLHRAALDHLGVDGRPVSSGAGSVEIWVPVADGYGSTEVNSWVEAVTRAVQATAPDLVSSGLATTRRGGQPSTIIAPFSPSPAPGAPVSVPLTWEEIDDELWPAGWTISDVGERVEEAGDPLAALIGRQQRLPPL